MQLVSAHLTAKFISDLRGILSLPNIFTDNERGNENFTISNRFSRPADLFGSKLTKDNSLRQVCGLLPILWFPHLRQVCGLLPILRFLQSIDLTATR
jgi:hypothetical protein